MARTKQTVRRAGAKSMPPALTQVSCVTLKAQLMTKMTPVPKFQYFYFFKRKLLHVIFRESSKNNTSSNFS